MVDPVNRTRTSAISRPDERGPLPEAITAFTARIEQQLAARQITTAWAETHKVLGAVQGLARELSRSGSEASPSVAHLSPDQGEKEIERILSESRRTLAPGELAPLFETLRAKPQQGIEVLRRVEARLWTLLSTVSRAKGDAKGREEWLTMADALDDSLSHTLFERAGVIAAKPDTDPKTSNIERAKRMIRAAVNNAHESGLKPGDLLSMRDRILETDPDWRAARGDPTFVAFVAELFSRYP